MHIPPQGGPQGPRDRPNETKASVQGFGNVAQYAIELYNQYGGTVVAVSCWDQADQKAYTFVKEDGVDLEKLREITDRFGSIDKEKAKDLGYEIGEADDWLKQDVDILIPAALENQINKENVGTVKDRVKVIVEGANGPTTPEADAVLNEKGVMVVPDFLANAGGVTCSYFEQVQCNMNYFWPKDEVLGKLDEKMTSAFHSVLEVSKLKNVSMRDAAYMIAISRVAEASHMRGWI